MMLLTMSLQPLEQKPLISKKYIVSKDRFEVVSWLIRYQYELK